MRYLNVEDRSEMDEQAQDDLLTEFAYESLIEKLVVNKEAA